MLVSGGNKEEEKCQHESVLPPGSMDQILLLLILSFYLVSSLDGNLFGNKNYSCKEVTVPCIGCFLVP